MITTLTILSLDQGRIYSPPPEPEQEPTVVEGGAPAMANTQGAPHRRWLNVSSGLQALARLLAPTFGNAPVGKAR